MQTVDQVDAVEVQVLLGAVIGGAVELGVRRGTNAHVADGQWCGELLDDRGECEGVDEPVRAAEVRACQVLVEDHAQARRDPTVGPEVVGVGEHVG